jgi:uncharacterized protein with ATP-grasp and redox domains
MLRTRRTLCNPSLSHLKRKENMKANLECVACSLRQALRTIRVIIDYETTHEAVLRQATAYLAQTTWKTDPITLADGIHKLIHRLTGIEDPYKALKHQSNKEVLRLYPELQELVRKSDDPILTACKLSVAGNIMDFGVHEDFNIHQTIQHVLSTNFAVNHYDRFKASLKEASSLLLFADNAGEIVFDKLLLETILEQSALQCITVVVKGIPILNDITMEDVQQIGLTDLPNIRFLTVNGRNNGNHGGSVWLHPEAEQLIQKHDVALSKGQANYEIMNELQKLFCLLIAKCDIVGKDTGTYNGALIFKYSS